MINSFRNTSFPNIRGRFEGGDKGENRAVVIVAGDAGDKGDEGVEYMEGGSCEFEAGQGGYVGAAGTSKRGDPCPDVAGPEDP